MTFKTKDRVLETSTTTGTGTYTLAGAATGFQTFLGGVVSAGDFVPYYAEDGTNWEAGIGEVLSTPARLARTTVMKSSNGNAAVDWGAGTRNLRCGWPAELNTPRVNSVSIAGGAGDTTLTQTQQRCDVLILTGALTGNRNAIVDATPWHWIVVNATSGAFAATVKVSGQTGVAVAQGKSKVLYCDGTDVEDGNTDVAGANAFLCDFRLTLSTGVPVTTSDVTAAETLYFAPYKGNKIALYDGSAWNVRSSAQMSIDVPDVTGVHDVFCYDNAGTPTLEVLVWTNDTTRATALTTQDGVLVKSGDATRRYVGTFYSTTAGNGQIEDSAANRYLWNYYNRVAKPGAANFTTARTTTSASSAEINSEIRNNFVIGVSEDAMQFTVGGGWSNSGSGSEAVGGVAFDGTTIELGAADLYLVAAANNGSRLTFSVVGAKYPGIGKHYATVCGLTGGGLTLTFAGGASVGTSLPPVQLTTMLPR